MFLGIFFQQVLSRFQPVVYQPAYHRVHVAEHAEYSGQANTFYFCIGNEQYENLG